MLLLTNYSNTFFVLLLMLLLISLVNTLKETFASVWRSSRIENPTRNMSYDIRGQPPSPLSPPSPSSSSQPFNPHSPISPWGISTLPSPASATFPRNTFLTETQFKNNSIGLIDVNSGELVTKGYLKGWPKIQENKGSWINPALLNTEKRWGFYAF